MATSALSGVSMAMPSGLDDTSIINQLVQLEQDKITPVQNQVTAYQTQISDYSQLQSNLTSISTAAQALNKDTSFDLFQSGSTDSTSVSVSGSTGAEEASYDVRVFHLAQNEKMISADGKITSQTAALSTMGITLGIISIDGTQITIANTDTIQDLRSKINSATDSDGNELGVTASVIQTADSNYRIVLSARETSTDTSSTSLTTTNTKKDIGAAGVSYLDVTGTTLEDLGIINSNTTGDNKGNVAQSISTVATGSQDTFANEFNSLAVGAQIQITGTDHDGNKVTGTFVKTSTSTINDFISQVNDSYHNMATVAVDSTSGQLSITDKASGTSQLSLASISIGSDTYNTTTTTVGKNGAGVLSAGSDAYFSVDGLNMSANSNSPDSMITGVTFNLYKVTDPTSAAITVELDRDTAGIQKNVQSLLDAYNTFLSYATSETQYADPNDSTSKAGDLAGDMTVQSMMDQVGDALRSQLNLFGGSFTSLTSIGINSDATTGQMSIDSATFSKVITQNFDQFEKLFITTGIATNKNVVLGRNTSDTQSGSYTLREINGDSQHMQIQLAGDSTWYTSDARVGDVVTFSSGPAKGLSLSAPAGTVGTTGTTFTFQNGVSDVVNNIITNMTQSSTGTIAVHQDSLNTQVTDANNQITDMTARVSAYHDQLVAQFSAMEQALQKMKSQYAQMTSALGTTTST